MSCQLRPQALQSSCLHDFTHKEKSNTASTETKRWQNTDYVKKNNQAETKLK